MAIKDSGERREFETGAVRDIAKGKGRMDLVPWDIISDVVGSIDCSQNAIEYSIGKFLETGDPMFIYKILNDFFHSEFLSFETMILELAEHFEEGALKYKERNWEKGIPCHCFVDSAMRHYYKYKRGDVDERHDRAFVWNLVCLLWTIKHKPELNDLPFAK